MAGKKAVKKQPVFTRGIENSDLKIDLKTYERFFKLSKNFSCIAGLDGYFRLVNPSFRKYLGCSLKGIYSRAFMEFIHPEDRNIVHKIIKRLKSGDQINYFENRWISKDGSYRFLGWTFSTDMDKGLIYASVQDLMDRRKLEEQIKKVTINLKGLVRERTADLRTINRKLKSEIKKHKRIKEASYKSEQRFYAVAKSTIDLIWEGDVRKNSLHWFGDIDKLLGYELGKFPRTIGGHLKQIHPEDRRSIAEKTEEAVKTGKNFEVIYRIKHKDGTYRYWNERGKPLEFAHQKAVRWVGSVTDITNLKKAEDDLRKSKDEYKKLSQEFLTLLDAIPDNILLLAPDMKIIWANKTAAARFNKNIEELTGQYCYKLCCGIFSPCKNCPTIKSYLTGREETAVFKSPSGLVWDIRSFPIKDESGQVKNIIELARDITVKVQMENESKAIQMRLVQENKMTSLGTLVSGIIHEINNPNSFIMSNSRLIKRTWKDNRKILEAHYRAKGDFQFGGLPYSEMRTIMPQVIEAVNEGPLRIHKIITNLRDFVRQEKSSSHVLLNVNEVVKSSQTILNHQIKKHTNNFHVSFKNDVPPVRGNSQQIEQVLINLIMNSLQALSNKKQGVWVSASFDNKSQMVIIQVMDEGSGIPEDIIGRIIEPFFTTKLKSGGTGLGLSISYNIIKEHNGLLEFRSEQGKGTTATVRLPAQNG
ncbi:MAG: PAS domain-containing protein [Nitrospirae bacterium]|nr:PAS domain-containing protein [Nitrospirota bacterium]